jgi:hypothetical protein
MVDIDAAVGFVVARGDAVERARLTALRTGAVPAAEVFASVEAGQAPTGGWPARGGDEVASVDATCFRLAQLDDLDGLLRPAAVRALRWLAAVQALTGFWEEDPALADTAPIWARPGDPEARFYLTANASFWLAVASGPDGAAAGGAGTAWTPGGAAAVDTWMDLALTRASTAILNSLSDDGSWPGFLVSGWLAAAVLHRTGQFYQAALMSALLAERVPTMSAADAAWLAAALRRVGVSTEDIVLVAARDRLSHTQRSDGGWPSDDDAAFDVHVTLTALRALR